MDLSQLTPRRPYLLRAFYEWLLDNQLTPHLVVDVTLPGVQVPMEYARDGQIVLNIAPRAVGNLELANDEVRFNARFGGIPRQVSVPLAAVLAIYARENGAGTMVLAAGGAGDLHILKGDLIFPQETQDFLQARLSGVLHVEIDLRHMVQDPVFQSGEEGFCH